MLWLRTWKLGTKSLALHPLRTGLTMLGIMIGVWAVIVLTAISQGASDQVQKQIEFQESEHAYANLDQIAESMTKVSIEELNSRDNVSIMIVKVE